MPYLQHNQLDCTDKLIECVESIDREDMDCDTCLKTQERLSDKIDDPELLEFAIENFSEKIIFANRQSLLMA